MHTGRETRTHTRKLGAHINVSSKNVFCTYFMHVITNSDEFRLNFAQKKFYAHTDFKILEETLLMSLSELVLNKFPVTVQLSFSCLATVKKASKHRQRARCTSPYSTDSNYSSVNVPHRPYPKSERRRQLRDQQPVNQYKTQPNNFALDEKPTASTAIARPSLVLAKSQSLKQGQSNRVGSFK